MTTKDAIDNDDPFQRLDYFLEWGGKSWERLASYAITQFIGQDLSGQNVLDIGARFGKMACLFAIMGANVVGTDLKNEVLLIARREAKKWEIDDKVLFVTSLGDLATLADSSFDVIFTKSVLVVVNDLERFLLQIRSKLKPGGKLVLLENAKGNPILHALRSLWHRNYDYTGVRYFTHRELKLIATVFGPIMVKKSFFPPVFLILGYRRPD